MPATTLSSLIPASQRTLFGCSIRNLSIDFGEQEDTYTATIIKAPGQIFQLQDSGFDLGPWIITQFSIGNADLLGIVQSWEEKVVDINGTGIFDIRMKIPSTFFMENIKIVSNPDISSFTIEDTTVNMATNTLIENVSGVKITDIFNAIQDFIFFIDNIEIKFDFTNIQSELNNLNNYRIRKLNYTLADIINQLTFDYGLNYSFNFGFEDNVLNIAIIIDNEIEIDTSDLDGAQSAIDYILDKQSDKIINITQGFESHGITRETASVNDIIRYRGGYKQELLAIGGTISGVAINGLKQFWGFDENNNLLTQPTIFLGDDLTRPKTISIADLEGIVNQTLFIDLPSPPGRSLEEVKQIIYIKENLWGRKFVIDEDKFFELYQSQLSLLQPTPFGWSEQNTDVSNSIKLRQLLQNPDGRISSYIVLPSLNTIETVSSGSTTSFIQRLDREWDESVILSPNIVLRRGFFYMSVSVEKINGFFIVTLPVALTYHAVLTVFRSQGGTSLLKLIEQSKFDGRPLFLNNAFIAFLNQRKRYGPFIFYKGTQISSISPLLQDSNFEKFDIIDDELVPWNFSDGLSNNTNANNNIDLFLKKQETSATSPRTSSLFKTGSIEVADLPLDKILLKRKFPYEIGVNRLNISFGINGIRTLYKIGLPHRIDSLDNLNEENNFSLLNLRRRIAAVETLLNEWGGRPRFRYGKKLDSFIEIVRDEISLALEPKEKQIDELLADQKGENELSLNKADRAYVYKKPEGGLGVIVDVEQGGPFYTVNRLNYADIDPNTFAGGLNISESYFFSEWKHVRNLAEDADSPGFLLPGTRVTVSIFADKEEGPFVPYMEVTPPVFAPPI